MLECVEVGENVKHSYEHSLTLRESKGEEEEGHPRQLVAWVICAHAAHAACRAEHGGDLGW